MVGFDFFTNIIHIFSNFSTIVETVPGFKFLEK